MMKIEYEQSLVETTVFLAVRGDERLECELHQSVDRLYEIADEEFRQREFVPVFRNFFTKLGFDRLIAGLLAERPLVVDRVDRCVVREAAKRKAESAELHVRHDPGDGSDFGNVLILQICPQSFLESERFTFLLRRDLLHVADMLDERFGYQREAFSGEPSRQNLQRDRYRVLWDTYVEGRLARERRSTSSDQARFMRAFGRAFGVDMANDPSDAFNRLLAAESLTHRQLMDWACAPAALFKASAEAIQVGANTATGKSHLGRGGTCVAVNGGTRT